MFFPIPRLRRYDGAHAVFMLLAVLLLGACDDSPTGMEEVPRVVGATYDLRRVDGAELPARFEDCDDPEGIFNSRIHIGEIWFRTKDRVQLRYDCVGDGAEPGLRVPHLIVTDAPYRQDGARVLIEVFGDDAPPDTAFIRGDTLMVHARFKRDSPLGLYMLPMVYVRR